MPRPSQSDTRYLERHHGKWRVSVSVPRPLHGVLGTRLKQPLDTDSLAVANRLKWDVVAAMRRTIDKASRTLERGGKGRGLTAEAMEWREAIVRETEDGADPVMADLVVDRAEELERQHGTPTAKAFVDVATGRATPLDAHHDAYMAQQHTKARTKADDLRAIAFLKAWCEGEKVPPVVEAITRKAATRFADGLAGVAGGQSPATLNKYIGRLSRYWQWLAHREYAAANVWQGIKIAAPATPHTELERAFTDDEMLLLLNGPATPAMHDLMRIAALTGARLDAIVDLKVGDCADGLFVFKPQKKEPTPRAVPIHSALLPIVKRRTAGKAPGDDVFPEWPAPRRVGSLRERSFKASNAFTAYRRDVGVDVVVPGRRRSLTNFHSFRRWFITKAERADQPESIIAVVVGHKRKGMTLGRYSAGPLLEQARRCVEAVVLPMPKGGA